MSIVHKKKNTNFRVDEQVWNPKSAHLIAIL